MYCTYCGKEINEGANFCPYCGNKIEGNKKTEKFNSDLIKRADGGDLNSIEELGLSLYFGENGFEVDNDLAFKYLCKAYEMKTQSSKVLDALGGCYFFGYGTDVDKNKGIDYYRKSAELGYEIAMFHMGKALEELGSKDCVEWYNKACSSNHKDAYYRLYPLYKNGVLVEQDFDKSRECLLKAVDLGNVDAMCDLGYEYSGSEADVLFDKDDNQYFYWTQKAAEGGNEIAMSNLARIYWWGSDCIEKDIEKAIYWAKKASDRGENEFLRIIGIRYATGDEIEQDIEKANELYSYCSNNGDCDSMFLLACLELKKAKIKKVNDDEEWDHENITKGLYWLKKSAEKGNESALNNLLPMMESFALDNCPNEYYKVVKKGADNGHFACMYELSRCYGGGYGTEKNSQEALNWLEKAAEGNNSSALLALGHAYKTGDLNLKKDEAKAFELYERAAGFNGLACIIIGDYYSEGNYVSRNLEKAFEYYKKAYELGDLRAALKLGKHYYFGFGTDKNEDLSIKYFDEYLTAYPDDSDAVFLQIYALAITNDDLYEVSDRFLNWTDSKAQNGDVGAANALYQYHLSGKGQLSKAVPYVEMVVEKRPDRKDVKAVLSRLYVIQSEAYIGIGIRDGSDIEKADDAVILALQSEDEDAIVSARQHLAECCFINYLQENDLQTSIKYLLKSYPPITEVANQINGTIYEAIWANIMMALINKGVEISGEEARGLPNVLLKIYEKRDELINTHPRASAHLGFALENLGNCYLFGALSFPRDLEKAYDILSTLNKEFDWGIDEKLSRFRRSPAGIMVWE